MRRVGLCAAAALVTALAVPSLGIGAAGLPDPCRLLASAHPETAFANGTALSVTDRSRDREYAGVPTRTCSETVGTTRIWFGVSTAARALVPVDRVRSRVRLSGPGSGATLTVYVSRDGRYTGEALAFHRGVAPARASTYASLMLVGAVRPATLKTVAARIYAQLSLGRGVVR
jgi:hypothetical protein